MRPHIERGIADAITEDRGGVSGDHLPEPSDLGRQLTEELESNLRTQQALDYYGFFHEEVAWREIHEKATDDMAFEIYADRERRMFAPRAIDRADSSTPDPAINPPHSTPKGIR